MKYIGRIANKEMKMKFAGRINSIAFQTRESVVETIERYHHIHGITHLEFNYPEHLAAQDMDAVKRAIGDMSVNGVAMRFKEPFLSGEFTNSSETIRRQAIDLCKQAIDSCRDINGKVLTIWQAYDGFDYPFQLDYEKAWRRMIDAFHEICDYGHDIRISIEYKPFEPRSYAMLDSIGTTLLAVSEVQSPNLGVTLDFCHMLMKHDCPSAALALAAKDGRLFGLHMNDGHGAMDNGLIFGTINTTQALEFVYYLNRYHYDGVVFFDSFPIRESAIQEIEANIEMYLSLEHAVNTVGYDMISQTIEQQNGVVSQKLVVELMRNM